MYPEFENRMDNTERRRTAEAIIKYKSFVRDSDFVTKYIYFQMV